MMTARRFDGRIIASADGGDKRDVFTAALEKIT
jgi:hypothetical protein